MDGGKRERSLNSATAASTSTRAARTESDDDVVLLEGEEESDSLVTMASPCLLEVGENPIPQGREQENGTLKRKGRTNASNEGKTRNKERINYCRR